MNKTLSVKLFLMEERVFQDVNSYHLLLMK